MALVLFPSTRLSNLIEAIKDAEQLLGGPTSLVARSVAVYSNGKWHNYGSTVEHCLQSECPESVPPIEFDQVILTQGALSIAESFDLDSFRLLVAGWRDLVGAESGYSFQDSVQPRRFCSDLPKGRFPGWECNLFENLPHRESYSVPGGPFLAPDRDVFAPDVPSLAEFWLRHGRWRDRQNITHEYQLVLEDRRARMSGFTAAGADLTVRIDGLETKGLFCGAAVRSFAGIENRYVTPIADGRAEFHFPYAVQELDLWVMLPGGYALDSYHESPSQAAWGREHSIYNRPPEIADPKVAALKAALSAGESQTVEFKPFIRLRPRDPKAREILETASAFANSAGGDLFVGVTDYAEPVGIGVDLQKSYGARCKNDLTCLRDEYVRDLKLLLNEGVVPPLAIECKWFNLALNSVLCVRVPRSDVMTHLIENGEIFVRVGATNRKVRPSDHLS